MEFWSQQRVVVTGGAGFLGRHVVELLHARGAAAVVVPRRTDYDLRERDAVRALLADARPTLVIHLAAVEGGIAANDRRPAEFFYDNAIMGIQLLHESWRAGVGKFVGVGTVASYPKYTPVPFHEDDVWHGYPDATHAPYGLAKKMLLVQGQAYRQQYGFDAIHLLPVNLYGPGDRFELETARVIPALIRRCLEAQAAGERRIVLWGDGSPTREFLYVTDAAEGILLAGERYNKPEPVNLGTGDEISIADLARLIARLTGFTGVIDWDPSRPGGQPRRVLDVGRAQREFGFRARVGLEEGLRHTIDWYRSRAA